MILSCNSCEKKFVVPDSAITPSGRLVQCSACGNKWKQFLIISSSKVPKKTIKAITSSIKVKKVAKSKIKKSNKRPGPSLYTPEYLAKKHGVNINIKPEQKQKNLNNKIKVNFGFYNFSIVTIIITTFLLRILYFVKSKIIMLLPESEIYINYLFETLLNIQLLIQNFLAGY